MEPVGLRVQGFTLRDQVLVLARLVQARSDEDGFRAVGVNALFDELRLPRPAKTHNVLVALERDGLIRKAEKVMGLWRVTPKGVAAADALVSGIDLAALAAEAVTSGTVLGGAPHPVILPEYGAPPALVPILREFLREHPFDHNVLGMTRFPSDGEGEPPDPVKDALAIGADICRAHGLEFHLASARQLHDDLWTNVTAHMWASRYGIAFFEDLATPRRGLNYNLTIEVGAMLMTGRRTALLKDKSVPKLPTDLVGRIFKDVDLSTPTTVADALHAWAREDLGLGSCAECRQRGVRVRPT
jgi:hypothetical protein